MLFAVHYRVMEHVGSLESTQEARVARGYRLGQLLRFFRALQTSRVLHNSIVHAKAWTRKFRRTLLYNEEPYRAQALQDVKLLEGLTYDKTRTSQKLIYFGFENDDVTWNPRICEVHILEIDYIQGCNVMHLCYESILKLKIKYRKIWQICQALFFYRWCTSLALRLLISGLE